MAMKLESKRFLRGPNRWSDKTAIEGVLVVAPAAPLAACWNRLSAEYPELCARVVKGEPRDVTSALFWAELVARLAVELQVAAKIDVSFSQAARLDTAQEARFVAEYREEASGERAVELALELVAAASDGRKVERAREIET